MRVSIDSERSPSGLSAFCERHYPRAAALVLALSAFNLSFRINREVVTEWDEALYAISAAETALNGNWIGTTFDGQLDYYNTKPPLNVWLIAVAFKLFGPGLTSLRLPSLVAAWLTVFVLMAWARRAFGATTALFAGVVLSTTFGFIYVHAARSGNTDALFTLLMLLVAVVLWAANEQPWRLVWLGPLVAGIFLLRGMAALMPLILIALVMVIDIQRFRERRAALLVAAGLLALPVGAWMVARWRLDGWQFIGPMFHYDFVARSARALEGHTGTPLYYLNVLQKDQYDWLLAAVGALILFPLSRTRWRAAWQGSVAQRYPWTVAGAWIAVTLGIPTLMQTKVAWYLNPFFPIFAILVAWTFAHGLAHSAPALARRRRILAGLIVLALAVAESKLIWYSYNMRDLKHSAQGLILEQRDRLAGHRVFRHRWPRSGRFVLRHIVGGNPIEAESEHEFLAKGARGDYLLIPAPQAAYSQLACDASNGRFALCPYPR